MLGLGEKEPELFQTMDDLREIGCQVLTLGQYLRPTPQHLPVVELCHAGAIRCLRRNRPLQKASITWRPVRSSAALITRRTFTR